MPVPPPPAAPAPAAERLTALDALRGFALLGILLMNIVGFGLHPGAYDNPTAAGGATGASLWSWFSLHVLAEGQMRCLFSLVFGASVILFLARLEGRPDAADLYYRRTLWLLAFGIAHSYLLWQGEILYPYAVCGLVLYPFRRLSARGLAGCALLAMLVTGGWNFANGWQTRAKMEAGQAALAKEAQQQPLTREEEDARDEWRELLEERNPTPEALAETAAQWRGHPGRVIAARAELLAEWHGVPMYHYWMLDILSMMLLGMALMKLDVLTGRRPPGFYLALMAAGYSIGIPVNTFTGVTVMRAGFDPVVQGYSYALYDVGRLAMACGHMGLVLLLCRRGWLGWLTRRLGAVGQTAFSNYVLQSVVCAFLFTGYGLGLHSRLQRFELYYVVAALWIVHLALSPVWLRHFRYGPLEWAWRSLTYWQRQPMRRGERSAALPAVTPG
ncbi:MAG: DUF418 domain-containing protein [Limisphaerales bacterium]